MSTFVAVNTYTHSTTYVTEKILMSLKDIIRESGLTPGKLTDDWEVLERGIRRWLETKDLTELILEVFNPANDRLVGRWDFTISYGFAGDGEFWIDTEDIKYHIKKAGCWPSACEYRVVATTNPGRPDVSGWSSTTLRSTSGFVRQSIGTTIDGSGLATSTAYWRKA